MDRRTQTPQAPPPGDQPADPGPGQGARPTPEAQKGAVLNIGPLLVQTIRHFWPLLNAWLDDIPDPRPQASVTYAGRFLLWWGLSGPGRLPGPARECRLPHPDAIQARLDLNSGPHSQEQRKEPRPFLPPRC